MLVFFGFRYFAKYVTFHCSKHGLVAIVPKIMLFSISFGIIFETFFLLVVLLI